MSESIALVGKLKFEIVRDGIVTLCTLWGPAPAGVDLNTQFPTAVAGDLAISIDDDGVPYWSGRGPIGWSIASDGGQPGPQETLQIIDALTGKTAHLGVRGRKITITFPEFMVETQLTMGGIEIDEGLSPNIYVNANGNYEATSSANGYNSAGVVSQEWIDSPDQWFVLPSVMPESASFKSQGFGLVSETIVDGNAPSGISLWAGAGTGGAEIMGMLLNSGSGYYTWTTGSHNADSPGGLGTTVNNQIPTAVQKLLSAARRSSPETGLVSYTETRVGINADGKLAVEWYLPQEAIDDVNIDTGSLSVGWKKMWTSGGTSPAGAKLRFKWVGRVGGAEMSSTPYLMGASSIDQRYAASGYYHYIVKGISDDDASAAHTIIADNGLSGVERFSIVKYIDAFSFDASEVYSEHLPYTEAIIVSQGPLFNQFDIDTPANMIEASSLVSALAGLRSDVCDHVADLVRGYFLIRITAGMPMADVQAVVSILDPVIQALDAGMLQLGHDEMYIIPVSGDVTQNLKDMIVDTLSEGLRKYSNGY